MDLSGLIVEILLPGVILVSAVILGAWETGVVTFNPITDVTALRVGVFVVVSYLIGMVLRHVGILSAIAAKIIRR